MSIPPKIADARLPVVSERDLARARYEAADLERVADGVLSPLAGFLIRTESVASSRIEQVQASPVAFARAIGGLKENPSAMSMVAAGTAITKLIDASDTTTTLEEILASHKALMQDDPDMSERPYAGRVRDMQNWIDGSQHSPRGALYVPPPTGGGPGSPRRPHRVLEPRRRRTGHPGSDRTRAVREHPPIHRRQRTHRPSTHGAILRRRGVTPHTVLPVASALAADTTHYFSLLTAYREGDADPVVTDLALCVATAAREARCTARAFAEYEDAWRDRSAYRAGSAADRLLPVLLTLPVFTVEQLTAELKDIPERSVYRAVQALEERGIVEAITERVRGRAYVAMEILDEFADLDTRIRKRITQLRAA